MSGPSEQWHVVQTVRRSTMWRIKAIFLILAWTLVGMPIKKKFRGEITRWQFTKFIWYLQKYKSEPSTKMRIESKDWVYERLICEFDHWDICRIGLIHDGDSFKLVEIIDDKRGKETYAVYDIEWNNECTDYLADYEVAYKHWFYKNGQRQEPNRERMDWFYEKWGDKHPIENATIRKK